MNPITKTLIHHIQDTINRHNDKHPTQIRHATYTADYLHDLHNHPQVTIYLPSKICEIQVTPTKIHILWRNAINIGYSYSRDGLSVGGTKTIELANPNSINELNQTLQQAITHAISSPESPGEKEELAKLAKLINSEPTYDHYAYEAIKASLLAEQLRK